MSELVAPVNPSQAAGHTTHAVREVPDISKYGYQAVLLYLSLNFMQTQQQTVVIESKDLQANAAIQDKLNKANSAVPISMLPPHAGQPTINRNQEQNQLYEQIRSDITSNLLTARQAGQMKMTQTSTDVQLMQQTTSQTTAILQNMKDVFQSILKMT
jgi:hypothetical protein